MQRAHDILEVAPTSEVCLHPLVLVNITDHFSRRNFAIEGSSKSKASNRRVIGILLGEQSDKRIEIHTSFEALFEDADGSAPCGNINIDYVKSQVTQYAKVYKTYEVVGWYITGAGLSPEDIAVTHAQVRENFIEAPLVLVLDTAPSDDVKTLPAYIFETVLRVEKGQEVHVSVRRVRYTVESEESERIGIDTAMQVDYLSEENPTLVPVAQRLQNAVNMLQNRIRIVVAYLEEVKSGAVEPDYELLRKISSLCNQLPCADSPNFAQSFTREYEDALLVTYMSLITKGCTSLNRLVEKSSVFSERRRPGGPMSFLGAVH